MSEGTLKMFNCPQFCPQSFVNTTSKLIEFDDLKRLHYTLSSFCEGPPLKLNTSFKRKTHINKLWIVSIPLGMCATLMPTRVSESAVSAFVLLVNIKKVPAPTIQQYATMIATTDSGKTNIIPIPWMPCNTKNVSLSVRVWDRQ